MRLRFASNFLSLDEPRVMGILNVTPDSFSDGGRFNEFGSAMQQAELMVSEGASIIDVGGESTRPGAEVISEQAEIDRVAPVIEALCKQAAVAVSVDTSKPAVMRAAVAAGATMINDIFALRRDGAMHMAASLNVAVCLMHMLGEPGTMQQKPDYVDVTGEVREFLASRLKACIDAGISRDRLCVDPGFGFGKADKHNLQLLHNLAELQILNAPLVVGLSRKRTLGNVTGKSVDGRSAAGVAAAVLAVSSGANIVRTHDVGMTVDALKMVRAVRQSE